MASSLTKDFTVKAKSVIPNVFTFNVGLHHSTSYREAYEHSAIFPEELAAMFIKTYTKKGQLVLDPFCGSGTTLVVAKHLQRDYIGVDISKRYIQITKKRLNSQQVVKL